jgi:DNA-directed RNA polymerase I, II, and III subunit RPABC2
MTSKKRSKKVAEPTLDDTKSQSQTQLDDDNTEVPYLEYVSDTLRERYEYKPVLRTEIIYRKPEDRITSEVMSKFEYCEVISIRARQLEIGGSPFTTIGELTDPIAIAKKEIADKKCPLSIVRMITDKIAEKWHVNELGIPYD